MKLQNKKVLVTCSPYMLIMGYEYEYKKDRARMIDREKSKKYYRKKKNENLR